MMVSDFSVAVWKPQQPPCHEAGRKPHRNV